MVFFCYDTGINVLGQALETSSKRNECFFVHGLHKLIRLFQHAALIIHTEQALCYRTNGGGINRKQLIAIKQ